MAISVKDIQEKVFATQASDGYSVEEVDDFLDALADRLGTLIRENLALNGKIRQLESALETAKAETAEAQKRLPDYNEESYFHNLEKAVREALIGAQRIADETTANANARADKTIADAVIKADKTVTDANALAEKTVSCANAQAEKAVSDANALAEKTVSDAEAAAKKATEDAEHRVSELSAEEERLRTAIDSYRTNFKRVMEQQLAALTEGDKLLG